MRFKLSDETARYKVPKHAHATTSLIIIDPMQPVTESVALARIQKFDFLEEVNFP